MNETPSSILWAIILAVSGKELLLGTHINWSVNKGISSKATRCISSCFVREVNLEKPQITLNMHSSHWGSLRNSPNNRVHTLLGSDIKVFNTSPEVVKSSDFDTKVTVGWPQILHICVGRLASEAHNLSIVTHVDCNIVVSGLEQNGVSVFRPLTIIRGYIAAVFLPNSINNFLSIFLARWDNLDVVTPGRRVRLSSFDSSSKHKIGKFHIDSYGGR